MSKQENHYQKALQMQAKIEAVNILRKVLGKSKALTLEEKLKDPNSLESKMLAAITATVVTAQWIEGAIAKATAELHYIEETLERGNIKGHGGYHAKSIHPDENEEEQQVEKPVGLAELQERLVTVKNQLHDLENYKTQLAQQYEQAVGQFKDMHGQEIKNTLEGFGITANDEQIEQFHELNKQKAAPLLIDRIIASHEQATQEAQAAGKPPPPPLPPPVKVAARQKQVREVGWEAALVALIADVYKNNPDPNRLDGNIRAALELLPLVRGMVAGQVDALENLHQYFEGKQHELGDRITEVENQRDVLESAVYKFASLLSPSMTPSFVSGQRQQRDNANEEAAEPPAESPNSRPTV